jgi:enterochelin esterase-like enzyme
MLLKPPLLLVVDDCHWYSSVPVWPLAAALLVKAAGS